MTVHIPDNSPGNAEQNTLWKMLFMGFASFWESTVPPLPGRK